MMAALFVSLGSACNSPILILSSNLSFTATFSKRKPLIFLEKVGGLWFLASEKSHMGLRWDWCAILVQKTELPD